MILHGNTVPIHIHIGTINGNTLSPFHFTIFMEPLLRWLAVYSRDTDQSTNLTNPQQPSSHTITTATLMMAASRLASFVFLEAN